MRPAGRWWRPRGTSIGSSTGARSAKVIYRSEAIHPRHHANIGVFDPLDFLAEVSAHIPDAHEKTRLFYGWYSNRTRGYRKRRGLLGAAPATEPAPEGDTRAPLKARRSWARLIRQVYEVESLVCASCGASKDVLAVIDHAGGICRALSHLNLWSSGGQSTGPTSEGTKPRIRLLGTAALEIVPGTIPFAALAMV